MSDTVVVVQQTGQILSVPTPATTVVVTGQGPQGPPGVPGGGGGSGIVGDVPVFIGGSQPTQPAPYIWYQKQVDGTYKIFVEDGT